MPDNGSMERSFEMQPRGYFSTVSKLFVLFGAPFSVLLPVITNVTGSEAIVFGGAFGLFSALIAARYLQDKIVILPVDTMPDLEMRFELVLSKIGFSRNSQTTSLSA